MEAREYPRIMPGVEVYDADGQKVGTVSHLHEPAAAGAGAESSGAPADAVFEVKTGPLGLGPHYYIPVSAVKDVTLGGVFVNKPKADFDAMGWRNRPASAVHA